MANVVYSGYFFHLFLPKHGDIKSNPGRKNGQINKNLSCCHRNTNRLLIYNFSKISLI